MNNFNVQRWEVSRAVTEYYMIYAMKTICDRALPDVRDGLKPVHRRILWKMFQMGMLSTKERTKSGTIVGEVLKIHGHGDSSIYDALCKLTEQQEGQICPYIDGEGAFGKQYLTDSPSAMRYTFARLKKLAEEEMMKDIKKGVVKMIGNGKDHIQPIVLPTTFPNILVKQNEGIAVGMSCYFPSFNLYEVCQATIQYILDSEVDLLDYIKAPDFSTGGQIIYNRKEMEDIINNGKGRLTVRSKYRYVKETNCIEVYEIPHNTTANAIINQVTEMIKTGVKEVKDILDIRDETGFNKQTKREELMIAIEVRRSADVEKLMSFLFKKTPLEKPFTANLNCLVDYEPRQIGVKEILDNWLAFRRECIVNSIRFDVEKMESELHFLKGLEKILLDIDKAIDIIRKSDEDEVTNNLCDFFKVDIKQAEEVVNMKLRYINRDYILKKIQVIVDLENEIASLRYKMENVSEIDKVIIEELQNVSDKYSKARKTEILYDFKPQDNVVDVVPNYNVAYFVTREGFFKKIPLTSLRSGGEHKLKDGDEIVKEMQGQNIDDILVFTNKGNIYRIKAHKLDDEKTSTLGVYLPSELKLVDEKIMDVVATSYQDDESVAIFYDNGYIARVNVKAYQSNYSMLKGNANCEIVHMQKLSENIDVMLVSSEGKALIFNTFGINPVSSRGAKGVKGMTLANDSKLVKVLPNPVSNVKFEVTTEKKGVFELKSHSFEYYQGSRGNIGVFLYNTRKSNDKIIDLKKL